jgi:putative ATPase
MLAGGEDVKFIARRLLILASEDIGNANPTALVMANSTMQAVATVGLPESRIILSQCATYLACSPKSNAAYQAINKAMASVKETGNASVPLNLRNAPTQLMKSMGYGADYKYAHEFDKNFVIQEFLPEGLENTKFYSPGENSREQVQREFLKQRWKDKYNY